MIKAFDDYMAAVDRLPEKLKCRLEESSSLVEGRMNVYVQAGTFDACQSLIWQVMEDSPQATFTIPVKTADGQYAAVGHYQKPQKEELPEL